MVLKYWRAGRVVSCVLLVALFSYGPMYGLQIAFRNFRASTACGTALGSHAKFYPILHVIQFNTGRAQHAGDQLLQLAGRFPHPVHLRAGLNCVRNIRFKKTVQMGTYAPHFISVVVIVSMIIQILSPSSASSTMSSSFWRR
jgi:ABC-type polysaccharide transport system permease subunit